MTTQANDVVITGIGIVTSLGIGSGHHAGLLATAEPIVPVRNTEFEPPYVFHPLPEIDWSEQIPRRGDQRQMENWQRLGVFAAGLALDDAGLKEDLDACSDMDLIVAAGGGERDITVDTMIIEESRKRNDREVMLNEMLTTELRPTLFLAQLSNLLAGNISIVHKVTGSSRTLMGEEGAGLSALETAHARIAAGQSTHCLTGAAFIAERLDTFLMIESRNLSDRKLSSEPDLATGDPDGIVLGTAGAFLVLESRQHAQARGARIYAVLESVAGDRGPRDQTALNERMDRIATKVAPQADTVDLVIAGAAGEPGTADIEQAFLTNHFPNAAFRSQRAAFGHGIEAQFPLAVALGALAIHNGAPISPFQTGTEVGPSVAPKSAVVTTLGFQRGEGMARLARNG